MAGRKLTHRQSRRVARQHEQRARDSADSNEPTRPGLVIARFSKRVDVEDISNPGEIIRCHIRANIESLVAGDRVAWRPAEDGGVVEALLERQSLLQRPDAYGRLRPVAANLDQIVIVLAPEPPPHTNLLDRYLVAAAHHDIEPLILLNKTDLDCEQLREALAPYLAIGYPVIEASAHRKNGLDALHQALRDHTSALVGQSGVGKSSLISALLPDEEIRIGELSAAESKGRHTTTTARLFHLDEGGDLIDSPGIREFALVHLDPHQTAAGFIEFRPFLGQCRFRDCQHEDEPGCAVREAVEQGGINPSRYDNYLQIIRGIE